ncbi:GHKL domain-containing protein [Candidatus Enterococcus palustris]|nr:GHKL domain-containing protein [Enterococcus sp. 7F3_DIV0205]
MTVSTSLVIGFVYFIFYLELINSKVTWLKLFLMNAVLTIVTGFFNSSGYNVYSVLTIFLILFYLGLSQKQHKLSIVENLYFSGLTVFLITFLQSELNKILSWFVIYSAIPLYLSTFIVLPLVVVLLMFGLLMILRKKISQVYAYLVESPMLYLSILFILICNFFLFTAFNPQSFFFQQYFWQFESIAYPLLFLAFGLALFFFYYSFKLTQKRYLAKQKESEYYEMKQYTEKLEILHEELGTFRHDYLNLLLSLDESIRSKDLEQIKQVYNEVIKPTSQLISNKELELTKLTNIKIVEIKSLLSVKVIDACQRNLNVTVDIPGAITEIYIDLVDFIRGISIVIDNAIEEAVQSNEKILIIAFFEVADNQLFVVKNSCSKNIMAADKLFKKAESTKEDKENLRGYGLFSLEQIVNHSANLMLETIIEQPYFIQILKSKKS